MTGIARRRKRGRPGDPSRVGRDTAFLSLLSSSCRGARADPAISNAGWYGQMAVASRQRQPSKAAGARMLLAVGNVPCATRERCALSVGLSGVAGPGSSQNVRPVAGSATCLLDGGGRARRDGGWSGGTGSAWRYRLPPPVVPAERPPAGRESPGRWAAVDLHGRPPLRRTGFRPHRVSVSCSPQRRVSRHSRESTPPHPRPLGVGPGVEAGRRQVGRLGAEANAYGGCPRFAGGSSQQ